MRIRLLANCEANKMLAEIIVAMLNKANKVNLMIKLTKDFDS